jgi:hypothetical protein
MDTDEFVPEGSAPVLKNTIGYTSAIGSALWAKAKEDRSKACLFCCSLFLSDLSS